MNVVRYGIGVVLGASLWSGARAQDRRILEVKHGSASPVAVRNGLAPISPLKSGDQAVWTVSTAGPASDTKVTLDPDVKIYEVERGDIKPSESASQSVAAYQADAIAGFLAQRGTVNFAGAKVRAGYPDQPAAVLIGLDWARQNGGDGAGVTVAVIDTGVDPRHPALADVLVPGYDFIDNKPGIASELAGLSQSTVALLDQSTVALLDQKNAPAILNQSTVALLDQSTVALLDRAGLGESFGHGTMVSGLIHLVAPQARIMPIRAFRSSGVGQLSDIVAAIYFAVDRGADVINMSFSFERPSPALQSALDYAAAKKVLCIASSGNNGRELKVYPAGYESSVLGIGSTTRQDKRSVFSNYGTSSVGMAAPGEALLTTYPGNNYAVVWGTSFSTALVSGSGALLASLDGGHKPKIIQDALEKGVPLPGQDLGEARLDLRTCLPTYRGNGAGNKNSR